MFKSLIVQGKLLSPITFFITQLTRVYNNWVIFFFVFLYHMIWYYFFALSNLFQDIGSISPYTGYSVIYFMYNISIFLCFLYYFVSLSVVENRLIKAEIRELMTEQISIRRKFST